MHAAPWVALLMQCSYPASDVRGNSTLDPATGSRQLFCFRAMPAQVPLVQGRALGSVAWPHLVHAMTAWGEYSGDQGATDDFIAPSAREMSEGRPAEKDPGD